MVENAPREPVDRADFGWEYLASKGIVAPNLRSLIEMVTSDFDADAAGFARLSRGATDPRRLLECATVSAHIRQCLVSAYASLGSACLHYDGFAEHYPDTMIGMGGKGTAEERWRRATTGSQHAKGLVSALSSALDTFAAFATVTSVLPKDPFKAAWRWIDAEQDQRRKRNYEVADRPLDTFEGVIRKATSEPTGWLDWLLDMRNALVHRPGAFQMFFVKERPEGMPQLLLVGKQDDGILYDRLEFSLALPRRPHLPEVVEWVTTKGAENLRLPDAAAVSMSFVLHSTCALIDDLATVAEMHGLRWRLPTICRGTSGANRSGNPILVSRSTVLPRPRSFPPAPSSASRSRRARAQSS